MEKLLIAADNTNNFDLLDEMLKNNYDVQRYRPGMRITQRTDLIIADGKTLSRIQSDNPDFKNEDGMLFQPLLLITPRKGISLIKNRIWQTVDDVITTPVSKMELFARVEILLRARRQSVKLNRLNSKLKSENDIMKQESGMLTDYFANVSHELRTPLSIIMSCADSLYAFMDDNEFDSENCRNTLDVSKRNCQRLLRIINNLLDMTKLDSGQVSLNLRNIDPVKTLNEIVYSVQDFIQYKDISMSFFSDSKCRNIAVDLDMFYRIMLNLLSNAIKYTPPKGAISVSLHDSGGRDKIVISIKDNGIGIPAEKQSTIFEPFILADETMSKRFEGCGLGLSLVKSLVERHGGKIWAESKIGLGSIFSFELPVMTADNIKPAMFGTDITDKINCELSDI